MNEAVFQCLLCAMWAALGAIAKQLSRKNLKSIKMIRLIADCFVSMVFGGLVPFVIIGFNWNINLAYPAAAVIGFWGATKILDIAEAAGTKKIGVKKEDYEDK